MSTSGSRREMRGAIALWALWLLAAGCDAEQADVVRETIGVAGGLVSSHDDVLTLVFQPGALDRDHEIVILPSDAPPPIFGPAYRVKPNIELAVDVEVTYRRVLPANPDGVTVAAIRLDDYTSEMGHWVPLPRLALDEASGAVLSHDPQLSLYYGMLELGATSEREGSTSDDSGAGSEDSTGDPTGHAGTIPPADP